MGRRDKRTSVVGLVRPPPPECLFNAPTHDISPLGRNGIFQFQMSAREKDRGLSSRSVVSQKKDEAASRLGITLLAFFLPSFHLSPSGSQDTSPMAAADFSPAGCLLSLGLVQWQPGHPHAGFLPTQWQLLARFVTGSALRIPDWYLT